MPASRILKLASVMMLGVVAAGGTGRSGTTASPGLLPVPTSSWRPGNPSLLALAKGTLEGGYEGSRYCVWLSSGSGPHPVVWPAGYHVRPHPLELLNSRNVVVAKGGDQITFGGGAESAQPDARCMLGQKDALYVMSGVSVTRR